MPQIELCLKNNESKQRKVAFEYVRLCGYKNGEIGNGRKKECQNGIPKLTLDEIASQLGMSKRDLQRALSIERNLTESMKELLDTYVNVYRKIFCYNLKTKPVRISGLAIHHLIY